MEIGRGIGFNIPDVGVNDRFGNRSWQLASSGEGFIFSFYPSPEHDPNGVTEKWDASAALEYLLERHNPTDDNDDKLGNWSVSTDALDWYEIAVRTDRRSVKAVVDDLVDRRRLAGYFVTAAESSGELDVTLNIFTFTDTGINLPSGSEIPANDNLVTLSDTPSPRVKSLRTRRMTTQVYDKIRVEGQPVTSTGTFLMIGAHRGLVEGWTSTQANDYIGLSGTADENTIRRASDEYRDVFSRFPMDPEWSHRLIRPSDSAVFVAVVPVEDLPDSIEDSEVAGVFAETSPLGNLWHMGKLWPAWTTLRDAETNEFRRPFVLFEDPDDGTVYHYAESLNFEGSSRQFACHVGLLPETPGVRVVVNRAGGQQLIASVDWIAGTPGNTPEALDPDDPGDPTGAVDYDDMFVTATFDWDERVYVEEETSARTPSLGQILRIQSPQSRLDFLLPGTVTDIDDTGDLVESDGVVLRDDRDRMREIATAAAQWYGATRQTLVMEYFESIPLLEVGQLVTDVNVGADSQEVLTPVTSVSLNFQQGTATFSTSYTDLDFS